MRSVRTWQALLLTGVLAATPAFAGHAHRSPTAGHAHGRKKPIHQIRGQRQIDSDRAREIQAALIRANYMTGEPSGEWNQDSQQAMQRYQADNHWQTKIIPDSRALIKLGLGPSVEGSRVVEATASPTVPEQKTAEPSKPADRSHSGTSSALTLADTHSIFD